MQHQMWAEAGDLLDLRDFVVEIMGLPIRVTTVRLDGPFVFFEGELTDPDFSDVTTCTRWYVQPWLTCVLWENYGTWLMDRPGNRTRA